MTLICDSFFYLFLLSCLNGKIALSKSNLFFSRITILCNEIADISGKHNIINFSPSIPCHTKAPHYHHLFHPHVILQQTQEILGTCFFPCSQSLTVIYGISKYSQNCLRFIPVLSLSSIRMSFASFGSNENGAFVFTQKAPLLFIYLNL